MGLVFEEGGERGDFKVGQTFLVRRTVTWLSRARFVNHPPLGIKLATQPAGVLDESFDGCRWSGIPRNRKEGALDSLSTIT